MPSVRETFEGLIRGKVLILDGGMGSLIQRFNLSEEDYRGELFKDHPMSLKGNNDLLNLTRPDVIGSIHLDYMKAGAEIVSTNTFNANAVSLAEYGMESQARDINVAGGSLARKLADEFEAAHEGKKVFVAGSMGPTNKTASMSPEVDDPSFRAVTYQELYKAYAEQAEGLIEGGVDILLLETCFDTLNAKAGLAAIEAALEKKGKDLPVMVSVTLSSQGRTFSGQTLGAFLVSIGHARITTVGLNCGFGAADMLPLLRKLAHESPFYVSAHPNAGLPNTFGSYDDTPEKMYSHLLPFVEERLVNILGGCCGTTPQHIARYPGLVKGAQAHEPVVAPAVPHLRLSGLEVLEIGAENGFIRIGERCNVAGSRRFLRLIKEGQYEEALVIARRQVEAGAQVLDVNMDDGLLDAGKEMETFLNLIASEPDIARVPVMIDSSDWEVIERGLMCVQGKSIVNSISLKEGEEVFLRRALRVRQLGAAVVVMAFDEEGQADTFERKIAICHRAYKLLTAKAGFPAEDIIFDPNVLAIATGIEAHNAYGLAFIRTVEWIKANLPGAKVSGGVSNLSFAFRGNNYLREAMHSVFLHHAAGKGMDMGIVNPSSLVAYGEIEPALRSLLEDVVLCRVEDSSAAAEELVSRAMKHEGVEAAEKLPEVAAEELPVGERLVRAMLTGVADALEKDLAEALTVYGRAVDIIDGPLMNGMNKVGELFGAGKLFLPQVVKTARTMKKAVAFLQPAIEAEKAGTGGVKAGKVLFATVKGDVHDIGKNIVSIVLTCNNYEVIDLGVMVPAEEIIRKAIEEKVDLVCLSGLITPSLAEMAQVAAAMRQAGLTIPLMIGGATTSKQHTALKIAPHYDYPVVHVLDASLSPSVAFRLLNAEQREVFIEELNREYAALRSAEAAEPEKLVPLEEARRCNHKVDWERYLPVAPAQAGVQTLTIPVDKVIPYINWTYFFHAWKVQKSSHEAVQLRKDAEEYLRKLAETPSVCCKAVYAILPANSQGDTIVMDGDVLLPVLRQQQSANGVYKSLADYILPLSKGYRDYMGLFAVTTEVSAVRALAAVSEDSYEGMLLQTLSDRLTEAASEYLHHQVRTCFWAYAPDEKLSIAELHKGRYQGIRPAIGYPSLPDQRQTFIVDKILDLSRIGISLTENGAMLPVSSACGLYIAHPSADYFMISDIDGAQLADYAFRRGLPEAEMHKLLTRLCSF
ncbi:MAG: methionine synthase [Tannerellaceae bacterium]|jgi:5-methyltetrahydrofolate--homocysteine methyltransferase|nr:methionine synthase [Tannerellaceae bacterium]